jgi:hypothetical protein
VAELKLSKWMNPSIIAKTQTFCNTRVNLSIASTEFQT